MPLGACLERLEERRLLAVTVTNDNLASFLTDSGYAFRDDTSVTVAQGTVIDAGSVDVVFEAPTVTIGEQARITTAGDVAITATKRSASVDTVFNRVLPFWSQTTSIIDAFSGLSAHVTVDTGAVIEADSLTIAATAGDSSTGFSAFRQLPLAASLLDVAGFEDVFALPLSFQWKQPSATIDVKPGASITTTSNVDITAEATADATGQAIWSRVADYLVKEKLWWQRGSSLGGGLAAGFSYADSEATATIASDVSIHAGGALALSTTTTTIASMSSRTTLNQGFQATNPKNINVALAATYLESTSRIDVAAGAELAAIGNVSIKASGADTNQLKATTASYRDGLVGVAGGLGWSYGTVEVTVDGSVTAGHTPIPQPAVFDPTFAVDAASNSLHLPEATDLVTGDEVRYETVGGGAIPGLTADSIYYAIVDPATPQQIQLAASRADARAGRAIALGGYPTLTTAIGTLPITQVEALVSDTLLFDTTTWPDGSPLFAAGDTVVYTPAAGQFLGVNDADGNLTGSLPAGNYRVRTVALDAGVPGLAIQLLPADTSDAAVATAAAIDLNDNPVFELADGTLAQVASFAADAGQVSFNFPQVEADAAAEERQLASLFPDQSIAFTNAQPLTYRQGFGTRVAGLVDGVTYYAIVNPDNPGTIELAETAAQAVAANPEIQLAVPTLTTGSGDDARLLQIDNVEPGTGLVFSYDPVLPAGTAVVFHAVSGKPVGGLEDGQTYYAYPQENPYFDADVPQYVIGLRAAADTSLPLLEFSLLQAFEAGGIRYPLLGIDTAARAIAVGLGESRTDLTVAAGSSLVGGEAHVETIPAGSVQLWTQSSGGSFTLSFPDGDSRQVTAAIAPAATAAAVAAAINSLGLAGVSVTAAFGRGTAESPCTLVGENLFDLEIDDAGLEAGRVHGGVVEQPLLAVSTTAPAGSFQLTLPGGPLSAPIQVGDTADAFRTAVNATPGLLAVRSFGTGLPSDPWLTEVYNQPLKTGDPLVFRDAWGSTSYGLVDGQTVYAVVAGDDLQGKPGGLVLGLADSHAEAVATEPPLLPLLSVVTFSPPDLSTMSGTQHTLASTLDTSGLSITARLTSKDSQSIGAANGSEPKLKDLLTRGEFATSTGNWSGVFRNVTNWTRDGSNSSIGQNIEENVGYQTGYEPTQVKNETWTLSASGGRLAVQNRVTVTIGSTARLASSGEVSLKSQIDEKLQSKVESKVSKPHQGKAGIAVAIDVVQVDNVAHTVIESAARIDGGQGVTIDSKVRYPWAGEGLITDPLEELVGTGGNNVISSLAKLVGGTLGIDEWFINHWSNAGVRQASERNFFEYSDGRRVKNADGTFKKVTKPAAPLAVTISGSAHYVSLANDCQAIVEDGAQINQDLTGLDAADKRPVRVNAATDSVQTSFSGMVYIDFTPDQIAKSYRKGESFGNALLVAQHGNTAIGGSVGILEVTNTTIARLGGDTIDGQPVNPAQPLAVDAGTGEIAVTATNNLLLLEIAQGGAQATNFGLAGSAAVLTAEPAGSRRHTTEAAIIGTSRSGEQAVLRAGNVDVSADDTTSLIPIAGAVLVSANKNVGFSTAIAIVDRTVDARVGDEPAAEASGAAIAPSTAVMLDLSGNLSVAAEATGAITPSALAATTGSGVKAVGDAQPAPGAGNVPDNAGDVPTGTWGLAVSGDFVAAFVTDNVAAAVNTHGLLRSTQPGASLGVSASNATLFQLTAGAASLITGDGSSAGLAGSVAVLTGSSQVAATLSHAEVQGFAATVAAEHDRRIGGLAASGSGSTAGNAGTTSVQIAGSVVVVTLDTSTLTNVDQLSGSLAGLSATATNSDSVWTVAGSFLFNWSPSGGSSGGASLGVGAAVAVPTLTTTTEVIVRQPNLSVTAGDVTVSAATATKALTFAGGASVTGAGSSLSGMFAFPTITTTTTAAIDGGSIDRTAGIAGSMEVLAASSLLAITGAGDLVLGFGSGSRVAAGAAVARAVITPTTTARVGSGTRLRNRKGSLRIAATSEAPAADTAVDTTLDNLHTPERDGQAIWTFGVGVVGSSANVTADFSWAGTDLTSARSATVANDAELILDDGSLSLEADNAAGIYSGAGSINVGIGSGTKLSAGAAVVKNTLSDTTTATLHAASITAPLGTIDITAVAEPTIKAGAAGGVVSTGSGLGLALVFNTLTQTVTAEVGGSGPATLSSAGLAIKAEDRSTIGSGAGQATFATGSAAGGAAAVVNTVTSTVTAEISGVTADAGAGTVSVDATSAQEIKAVAVGVAGAMPGTRESPQASGLFVMTGIGSGAGNAVVQQVSATIDQSSDVRGADVSVTASDTSTIHAEAASLAIQAPGEHKGVSAAFGISAAVNSIGSPVDSSGVPTDASKRSFVEARIDGGSTVTAAENVTVEATASPSIKAGTGAGASSTSIKEGGVVGITGAGAGSANTIQFDVLASLGDTAVEQTAPSGTVSVKATNTARIDALAGGVTIAGAFGENRGVAVTVGAAASRNEIHATSAAVIDTQAVVTTPGAVEVAAEGGQTIKAVSFGVAGTFSGGSGGGYDIAGAGSAAINTITIDTLATIRGSVGTAENRASSVSVTADNTSQIVAGAGALSAVLDIGGSVATGLSVGVSFTTNSISGTTEASIDGGEVFAAGDVALAASFTPPEGDDSLTTGWNVYAVSVAGSVAANGGGIAAEQFALAGAGNHNAVAVSTEAVITNGAVVDAGGGVALTASDRSTLSSNAGGVGLGLTFGAQGALEVAIGAARGENEIGNTVRTAVESSTVIAGGNVSLTTQGEFQAKSIAYGVALSAARASGAASAAGSGAGSYTTIANTVAAEALSADISSSQGDVRLSADNAPTASSDAGAGSLAVTLGNGIALAAGVIVAETSFSDTVRSQIDRAEGDSATASVVEAATGAVTVEATSRGDAEALTVAVAAAVSVGQFTGAFAGSGGRSTVTFDTDVTASVAAAEVTADELHVRAIDRDAISRNTLGSGSLSFGLVGGSIGVSLTESTVSNTASAELGDALSATVGGGGITVEARSSHDVQALTVATAVAVALGGAGAGGHAFATDSSTTTARVAGSADLTAPQGRLRVLAGEVEEDGAAIDVSIGANCSGGSVGLIAIGGMWSESTDTSSRAATVGDNADLSRIGSLSIEATATPHLTSKSIGVDIGGVAVTVNKAYGTSAGSVLASTGSGVTLPTGDVSITAVGAPRLELSQKAVSGGVLAAGATMATAESKLTVEAVLGADTRTDASRQGSLIVRARSHDTNFLEAVAGSGGVFNGIGVTADLTDSTVTEARLDGGAVSAGNVDVSAERQHRYTTVVDATNIALGADAGAAIGRFHADTDQVDGRDRVATRVADGMAVTARDTITVTADHRIERQQGPDTVRGVGGAVLLSEAAASSTTTADVPSVIEIGSGVTLTAGSDLLTNPGMITIHPLALQAIHDSAHVGNLGLVAAGGQIATKLTGSVSPTLTVGDDLSLRTFGDALLGTTAVVASSAKTDGWGGAGVGSGMVIKATADVCATQTIAVGKRAGVHVGGMLTVTAGDDPLATLPSVLTLDATATAGVRSLIATPDANATAKLASTSTVSFDDGGQVVSGRSMRLAAPATVPQATATGSATGYQVGFIPVTSENSTASPSSISSMTLRGSFLAGVDNRLEITVPNDRSASEGFSDTVQVNPSVLGQTPVANSIAVQTNFNPRVYLDEAGFSADVASVLRDGVTGQDVTAVAIATDATAGPLAVSGGSIAIAADSVDASGASFEGRVGTITVRNESPDYLLLGDLGITNVEGGKVRFTKGDGVTGLADPASAAIIRDDAEPTISIEQTFPGGVGDSSYGPAVFVAGTLANLGGTVSIHVAGGSFGQTGSIVAETISIDSPNGVFAVDTPQLAWSAAGVPEARWQNQISWPGGDPRQGTPNAKHAVMVAVNAMADVGDEDQLNRWAYGEATSSSDIARVFFGGSVPQYSQLDSNTNLIAGLTAAAARPDGQQHGWAMTDKGLGSNWDHQWVPRLQYLETRITSDATPPAPSGTAVRGRVIQINAKTVDINGTIEAGGEAATGRSILLDEALEAELLDYRERYFRGEVTAPLYPIPADRLAVVNAGDDLLTATFNARTKKIQIDEAGSDGGGRVSITGQIINTAGLAGRIRVTGGSGELAVTNETNLPLVIEGLTSGTATKQGVVSLTNTAIDDPLTQQTTYVYDDGAITVYTGAAGVDLPATATPHEQIAADSTSFSPRPNTRYTWQANAALVRDVSLNFGESPWPGPTTSSWRFANTADPWSLDSVHNTAGLTIDADPHAFVQRFAATYGVAGDQGSGSSLMVPYQDFGFDTGFTADHQFAFPNRVDLTMTMSVKADHPIGIDFSGFQTGRVSIHSVGNVIVAGPTAAADVQIVTPTGWIRALPSVASIAASQLTLEAGAGINSAARPLSISAEELSVESAAGDIHLSVTPLARGVADGGSSPALRDELTLRTIVARQGLVSITSAVSIVSGEPVDAAQQATVEAASLELVVTSGSIGTLSRPLSVSGTGDDGTLRIVAVAAADIVVEQQQGAMLVERVATTTGSVTLIAEESLYDAGTWTADPGVVDARVQAFVDLGATNPDAPQSDITAFEENVRSRYFLLMKLKASGTIAAGRLVLTADAIPLWRVRAAAATTIADPADAEVRTYAADLYDSLVDFFNNTLPPGWQSLPDFQSFNPGFAYQASPAQVARFTEGRLISEAALSVQLYVDALDSPSTGDATATVTNVVGDNVRLVSRQGGVGKQNETVTLTLDEIAAGRLTETQRINLTLARRPGDATTLDNGNLELDVRLPLSLEVGGRLDVDAHDGIVVDQPFGDLNIGHIGATDGRVTVLADQNLRVSEHTTIDMWGTPITFADPADWSLAGNAGQTITPQAGLTIPGYTHTASGTWFNQPVPTGSFQAGFTYLATSPRQAGDGLAFVLQNAGPAAVGEDGGGLGYRGIDGAKVAFQINLYNFANGTFNSRGTTFDTSGNTGPYQAAAFPLLGEPVHVTLTYDAEASLVTATLIASDGRSQTTRYEHVDLAELLGGPTAFMGFTSGTGDNFTTQQVTDFRFLTTREQLPAESFTFPERGGTAWAWPIATSPAAESAASDPLPWRFDQVDAAPVLVFPEQTNAASAAWQREPVRISSDFRVSFRYRYTASDTQPGDGMALVLQQAGSAAALEAVGGVGGGLGYSGIKTAKVGFLINTFAGGPEPVGTRFDTTGSTGRFNAVDLFQPDTWLTVTLTYDAESRQLLQEITDDAGGRSAFVSSGVNLSELLGGDSAYLGFTAASGAAGSRQEVTDYAFTAPAVGDSTDGEWNLVGGIQTLQGGRLTIPAVQAAATASWYSEPVTTGDFEVSFRYEARDVGQGLADGVALAFLPGTAELNRVGDAGGGLGYAGIPGAKAGVLIDLHGQPGIGFDQVGFTEHRDLDWLRNSPCRIVLRYDASAGRLSATVTASGRSDVYQTSWEGVDLARLLGPSAVLGITSGTGGLAAEQIISDFRFIDTAGINSGGTDTGGPTVVLRSTSGDIGTPTSPIPVEGRLQAEAPNGAVYTVSTSAVRSPLAESPAANAGTLMNLSASSPLPTTGTINRGDLREPSFVYLDGRSGGPNPLVIEANELQNGGGFVITAIANGRADKWDASQNRWVAISTTMATSNPRQLLQNLRARVFQSGDMLRWIPDGGPAGNTRALEVRGWNQTPTAAQTIDTAIARATAADQAFAALASSAAAAPTTGDSPARFAVAGLADLSLGPRDG